MTTTPFTTNNELSAILNTKKIRANTWLEYQMDKTCSWVSELLLELNENVQDLSDEEKLATSYFDMEIKLKKANKSSVGDYLLADLSLKTEFNTLCVKTGSPMKDSVEFRVKLCFLADSLSTQEEFLDQTEHFTDGEIYELYFLNKNQEAPLKDALHEQIFLNINFYPSIQD